MERGDFEDILILETKYYKELADTYRDAATFSRYIPILKKVFEDDPFIQKLEQNNSKELVYLGRKIFSLQEEFISNYLQFLSDESMVNKWERFFERYSKSLFEIYMKFVEGDSYKTVIFEVANRELLRDLLTKHTMDSPFEKRILVSERIGVVVNQLFNYMRNQLERNRAITETQITAVYKQIPLIPRYSYNDVMKSLGKRFLEHGLPGPLYAALAKKIASAQYTDTKSEVMYILDKKVLLSKETLIEIFGSHFFIPDDETLSEIIALVKKKVPDMIRRAMQQRREIEQKVVQIRQKVKETTEDIRERLISMTEDFSTEEPIESMVKKLRRNLLADGYDLKVLKSQLQGHAGREQELKSLLNLKESDLQQFIPKHDWDSYLMLLFTQDARVSDLDVQNTIKEVMGDIRKDKDARTLLNTFRTTGFLKEKYNTKEINEKFGVITRELIAPLLHSFLLEEMIEYYPKVSEVVPTEGVRYLAEEALAGRVSMIEKSVPVKKINEVPARGAVSHFKSLISTLIYDVRGSTFMGTKLQDGKRESEIRNYFQESMLAIVDKNGGVPIKDTGDGGIVLFAANHYDIKNRQTLELKAGSVLPAVRCALEMVHGARNFVKENIYRYKDWFREAEKRKIDFEGSTYATLPPVYRSIFQVGIGISSGVYPKEIYLEENAFGELDLTGMLVREANLYSRVKAREKSTAICDDATVYNLLLNVDKFSFIGEGVKTDSLGRDIEQGLEYWLNQKLSRRGFIVDLYKILCNKLGQEVVRPGSLKILLGVFDIAIDETGELKDEKGGRGKFLFELTTKAAE